MLNADNICIFEGRMAGDPKMSTITSGGKSFSKAIFNIAVPRTLTKEQRTQAKTDNSIRRADFVPCAAIGAQADLIQSYFQKGKPIKVMGSYVSYEYTDKSGNKAYGHNFDITNVSFVVQNNENGQGAQTGTQNSYQNNNQQPARQQAPSLSDYNLFDDDEQPY